MGNDLRTNWIHVIIIKIASCFLYSKKYRLEYVDMEAFDRGFKLGKKISIKNLNQVMPTAWNHQTIQSIRREIGL